MDTAAIKDLLATMTAVEAAESLGLDWADPGDCDEDCPGGAVLVPGWLCDDGNCEVDYPDADSGADAADTYVSDGDWGRPTATTWITVRAWRAGLGIVDGGGVAWVRAYDERHKICIDPEEPPCSDWTGHDWVAYPIGDEWGGARANGGGVIVTEICTRCGWILRTNTWAQDPCDGEQGLLSVEYMAGVDGE